MSVRPKGSRVGGVSQTSDGSFFRGAKKAAPKLPPGLPADIRKIAKEVLENAPWLAASQVPLVIRLAKQRRKFDLLEAEIGDRMSVFSESKDCRVPNPLIASQAQIASGLIALERTLCLSFVSQKQTVSEEDRIKPPKRESIATAQAGGNGAPKLRVA